MVTALSMILIFEKIKNKFDQIYPLDNIINFKVNFSFFVFFFFIKPH